LAVLIEVGVLCPAEEHAVGLDGVMERFHAGTAAEDARGVDDSPRRQPPRSSQRSTGRIRHSRRRHRASRRRAATAGTRGTGSAGTRTGAGAGLPRAGAAGAPGGGREAAPTAGRGQGSRRAEGRLLRGGHGTVGSTGTQSARKMSEGKPEWTVI